MRFNQIIYFIILFILLFPTTSYYYYAFSLIFIIGAKFFLSIQKVNINYIQILLIIIIIFFAPKLIVYNSLNDFKELFKITLAITILSLKFNNLTRFSLSRILFFILIINGIFVALQWLSPNSYLLEVTSQYLHPEHHIQNSLMLNSPRTLGIFSDNGEHGIIIFIIYLYFLSKLSKNKKRIIVCGLILSITFIILGQSKTTAIVFLSTIPILIHLIFKKNKLLLFTLIPVLIYYVTPFVINIEQYARLINTGSDISSLGAREEIWRKVFEAYYNAPPLFQFIGPGREYIEINGINSSVFDNDYVYIMITYGIIGVLFFGLTYILSLKKVFKSNSSLSLWTKYIFVFVPLISLGLDCLSSLKCITFLSFIFCIHFSNKHIVIK